MSKPGFVPRCMRGAWDDGANERCEERAEYRVEIAASKAEPWYCEEHAHEYARAGYDAEELVP